MNTNKPKNDSAWHYRSDLKPLQSSTEYVPVYGDRNRSPTAISDDKWQTLGKRRMDLLSKYGYSSHRDMKSISPGSEVSTVADDWQSTDPNKRNNLFDNCYILGECMNQFNVFMTFYLSVKIVKQFHFSVCVVNFCV